MTSDDWKKRSACRDYQMPEYNDWWFPEKDINVMPREARDVCASCPVLARCKKETLKEKYGNSAGMTPIERRRVARLGTATPQKLDGYGCTHCEFTGKKTAVRRHMTEGVAHGCIDCLTPICGIPAEFHKPKGYIGPIICGNCLVGKTG